MIDTRPPSQNVAKCTSLIMNFCHFVHFFASEESGARWTATHKGTFLLSLEEPFTLGQMTNARKFQGAL